jgi:NAD(P)H-dependent FMN reductase
MLKLAVVITSTRPGRVGLPVAKWFLERAKAHGKFEVELIDLLEVNLPHLDEPNHPRLQKYQHEHTKAFSKTIQGFDAFVFVTPEYNYGMPPALLNALNFLYVEWNYKAAAFVSYGGLSGGTRSVQVSRSSLNAVRMMSVPEAVNIPFVTSQLDEQKNLKSSETLEKSANSVLDELLKWSNALAPMRA